MKLKEAAYIIGSMGGRPSTKKPFTYKSGSVSSFTAYLLQENGTSRIILENGLGFLQLEF